MLPFYHTLEEYTKNLKAKSGFRLMPRPLFVLGLAILLLSFVMMPTVVSSAIALSLFLAPLWLPFVLIGAAWTLWVILRRSEYIAKQQVILLEVRPPRALDKTPLAMEAVLAGLHHSPGEGTWYKRFILGNVRPWWSLEIASMSGEVHLYIWTRAGFRRIIESNIYAQYPGAQVVEVPDYSRTIHAHSEEALSMWGCDFAHTADDPVPIKTYVEYGLDKVQKEPEQVDPLANLIEFMGSMRKGEYLWIQMMIRVHKGEKYHKLNKDGKPFTWKDHAMEMVQKLREETRSEYYDPIAGKTLPGFPNPTKGQSERIAAIERNVSKQAFDTGIRGIYLATPDKFDPMVITGLTGIFKQFSSEGWNGFKPVRGMTQFDDYPWEIGVSRLKRLVREELIDAYRRRQTFFEPYREEAMVMSTEELATLFHIPSRAVETPTFSRQQSATSEAPSNLPV